jgi:hypothetical protein
MSNDSGDEVNETAASLRGSFVNDFKSDTSDGTLFVSFVRRT